MAPTPPTPTFTHLLTTLTTHPLPLFLTPHHHLTPYNPTLTPHIASLTLHPTLESLLHILNHDLSSAHFLVRHTPSPPAWEGMLIHAILHRVEGDLENAAAWYGDAAKGTGEGWEGWEFIWGGGVEGFLGRVRGVKERGLGGEEVRREGEDEVRRVVEWCASRFGTGTVEDARNWWTQPGEEERERQRGMVVGGEGWRKF